MSLEMKMRKLLTEKAWRVIDMVTDKIVENLVTDRYSDSFLNKLKLDVIEEILKSQFDRLLDAGKYFRYLLNLKITNSFTDDDTGEINVDSLEKIVGNLDKFVKIQELNFMEKIMKIYIKKRR